MSDWCTIESDPGVFTELISDIGVKDVQVDEFWAYDKESLREFAPVHGLVLLFKYKKESATDERPCIQHNIPGLFFAKQVITNACATQAIMSVLLNSSSIDLGSELSDFKSFTADLDPEMRGLAIGNSNTIKKAHNSFAQPEPFMFESKTASKDDDAYHFIAYVPHGGKVYELDGLRPGPILLGEYDTSASGYWTDVVVDPIQTRMERLGGDIAFNLLGIVKDRLSVLRKELKAVEEQKSKVAEDAMEDFEDQEDMLKAQILTEEQKRESWKNENVRRRHNYIPLIYNLIKTLAANGKLEKLRKDAKEAASKHAEERAAKKAKAT